ncbi:CRISPR-associated endonuclease Cas2 [Brockia lithotrophica]|uniref:CRISPR-associated endoribonuclease Cas2 n=1 Tax=Brockia lithotrophica TaxID=933949 RepID=A0A660L762_9BACL|nr:CRISPR-associated endonuclease Cas2 [Brockia lithotrophica]RKQ88679.1 CRISPR-associated protein Cas2 [Brockia lithotrophica]
MYVIIVYDIEQERVAKVCQYLRRFLYWAQNSVFEGELSEAQLVKVKSGLSKLIDPQRDSVYIYQLPGKKLVKKEILGQEKIVTRTILE